MVETYWTECHEKETGLTYTEMIEGCPHDADAIIRASYHYQKWATDKARRELGRSVLEQLGISKGYHKDQ